MVPSPKASKVSTAMMWLARAGTVASILLLLQFVIGSIQSGDPLPTAIEAVGIACFPVGVVVGMLIAWRQQFIGASVSLCSLVAFYIWSYVVSGRINNGPYFVLFSLPAFFYLLSALIRPNQPRQSEHLESY